MNDFLIVISSTSLGEISPYMQNGFYANASAPEVGTTRKIFWTALVNTTDSTNLATHQTFKMSLWVDKYRPTTLSQLDYHIDVSKRLEALVSE
jgi:hypothetical protein